MNLMNHIYFNRKFTLLSLFCFITCFVIAQNNLDPKGKIKPPQQKESEKEKVVNKEQLRMAKKFAKQAFLRYIEREQLKVREYVIHLTDWSYYDNSESFNIEFEVHYEILFEDYYDQAWLAQKLNLKLNCDSDGSNAYLYSKQSQKTLIFTTIEIKK